MGILDTILHNLYIIILALLAVYVIIKIVIDGFDAFKLVLAGLLFGGAAYFIATNL